VTTLTVEAPPVSGSFTGYLAGFGKDLGGDTIGRGAMDQTLADFRAGRVSWLLTDGHADSNDTSGIVAYVTDAELDGAGLRVRGNWLSTPKAQQLREMANGGAPLGLSIDYLVNDWRPDGSGGRHLDSITVTGGAVVRTPMNSVARITESKGGATFRPSAPVVDVYADVQARHADPDRDRTHSEDALLAAVDWPPRDWPRAMRLSVLRGAAEAKAHREAAGDTERAREQARWDQDNAYSYGLAAWMAANR
jgi:hypothetical protein